MPLEMVVNRVGKCGTWTLGREIGRGAAGVVYLVTDAEGRFAAVKVCLREELGDGRYERELRGAKLYKRIPPSEGLVRLLELGECEWGFYTVMELADDEFGAHPGVGCRPKMSFPCVGASCCLTQDCWSKSRRRLRSWGRPAMCRRRISSGPEVTCIVSV